MANLITVGRLIVMFIVVAMIYYGSARVIEAGMVLIALVFASDGIDGWVARRRNSTSAFGAVLDIAGDRIVENVLWVLFAALGVVPLWIPFLVLTRSFIVDALRSLSYTEGMTAFGSRNMMRSPLTRWLTAGRFMRALFGYAKAIGFVYLTGYWGWSQGNSAGTWLGALYDTAIFRVLGWAAVWIAVGLTVIRGIPVVVDAWDTMIVTKPSVAGASPLQQMTGQTADRPESSPSRHPAAQKPTR